MCRVHSARSGVAAVEVDVGTGTDERIEIGKGEDPAAVAQRFCDAQAGPDPIKGITLVLNTAQLELFCPRYNPT
jgi:hypothetical protein